MTDTAMTTAAVPDGAPRLASLDILRGIAILGILFMNINDMGASYYGSGEFPHSLGWSTPDQVAWWVRELFWVGTARCMLEILFGVGMVILTERAANAMEGSEKVRRGFGHVLHWLFGEGAVMRGYYIRNLILFAFGLIHIFILLWLGDILHTYGIAALVAFLFRRLHWRWLLAIGLLGATLQLIFAGMFIIQIKHAHTAYARQQAGQTLSKADTEAAALYAKQWERRQETIVRERAKVAAENHARQASTGTFRSWAGAAWGTFLDLEAQLNEFLWVWEAAGTMLIGAALFRLGIVQGQRSTRFYITAAPIFLIFGVGIRTLTALTTSQEHAAVPSIGFAFAEYARLALTIGYICLIHLCLRSRIGQRLLSPFTAAGRVALSIYIAQTIVCLWILYPPFAFGLYGKQSWWQLMVTAAAVNAVLLVAANVYLGRFRIGPVEWVWRSLLTRQRLPICKPAQVGPIGGGVPQSA